MQSSLKKSLYLGLAAVSFVAAGAAASTTNASAKTYAKVTSLKTLKTDANTRNVIVTGSNAIATKAATLKGASTVKSAATLKAAQAADKTGNYNYRAYAVATTNRGSVYYKVVSFDKTVRGWIYGGNSTANYAGGLQQFATASDAKTENKSFTYNGQKLWAEPAWTQYKVGASKLTMTNGTKFTVNASKTNVKSGDLYYQIADGSAKGAWVKASDFDNATTPIEENQVRVNFVDESGKTVASKTYTNTSYQTQAAANFMTQIANNYQNTDSVLLSTLTKDYTFAGLSNGQIATNNANAANATYGAAVTVTVKAANTQSVFGTATAPTTTLKDGTNAFKPADVVFGQGTVADLQKDLTSQLTGANGATVANSDVVKAIKASKANQFVAIFDVTAQSSFDQNNVVKSASDFINGHRYQAVQYTFSNVTPDKANYTIGTDKLTLNYTDKAAQQNATGGIEYQGKDISSQLNFNY